jgi:pimeloyl-ACP methyl ester carboxylesterase
MGSTVVGDDKTGRKFTIDEPDDLRPGEGVIFLLNLHGGGSVGMWQHEYFPAYLYANKYRLAVATPSAATKEPSRRWVGEADDEHLKNIVEFMFERYGIDNIKAFWLVGHSQGGMTSRRLLNDPYFQQRVDGWLSLSGGRIGAAERAPNFGPPDRVAPPPEMAAQMATFDRNSPPDVEMSFIYTTGEHEIASLPETSPWAEKYGAGPRQRLADVVDAEPGLIFDRSREGRSSKGWGLYPRPGTAQVYVYPNARDGRVIADVVRLDKGHTEGLEPNVTDKLLELIASAPGGKARALKATAK